MVHVHNIFEVFDFKFVMAPPDKKPKYLDEKLNESLQLAIQDVQNGLSLRKAAKNHGIHHQTLSYKIKKMDSCFVKPGVSQTLTEECNAGLKDWILDRSEMGKLKINYI